MIEKIGKNRTAGLFDQRYILKMHSVEQTQFTAYMGIETEQESIQNKKPKDKEQNFISMRLANVEY